MFGHNTKKAFVTGVVALLPTALTIILLVKAYQLVANTIGSMFTMIVTAVLRWLTPWSVSSIPKGLISAVGVLLAVAFVFFLGMALASIIGRQSWSFVEKRFVYLPVIRNIYPSVKQITDFLFAEKKLNIRQIAMIEYPRKGVYSLGFVTGRPFTRLSEATGKQMVTVFMPSSPTPFTGYCIQVACDELIPIDITVDQAVKYIVSGGVILSEDAPGDVAIAEAMIEAGGEAAAIRENIGSQE